LGCLPRVEAAVLRRVSLCSCRGLVRAMRREEETAKPTRRPQRVRSSRGELSWLVWDAEDSLEFYPAQASQSFFSLPRSLRPRNPAGRVSGGGGKAVVEVLVASSGSPFSVYVTLGPFRVPGSVGGDRENRVLGVGRGSGSRVVTVGIRAWSDRTCSGSKLQQRSQARQLVEQQDESDMPAQGQVQEEVFVEESVAQPQGAQAAAAEAAAAGGQQQQEYHPQPQQYADWFPMAEQFFRAMYQGAWQPGQAAIGGQFPVPPPAVPEQQEVEPEVE
ncbi:hypothetical protein Taro_000796, partial [Colocasia esculenta]|nr:hypothetical protein [Colocasia esculenta]